MLDKDTCKQLEAAVLERLSKKFPDGEGAANMLHTIAQVSAIASVVALQEYEKLNSPD